MSYFLAEAPLNVGEIQELTGKEARHILLSRRIEIGEMIEIQGPDGKRFEAEVIDIDRKFLSIQAIQEIETPKESPLKITIFQALIKEQPLDNIIQKLTELGVDTLALFYSQNSVERFKDIEKKLERWKKITEEAAKQSGRVHPIKIEFLKDTDSIFAKATELDQLFLLHPSTNQAFSTWTRSVQVDDIGILVGQEGGFTDIEVANFLKLENAVSVSMGPRILRADTAAISSAAIVQSLWGDM